MDGVGQRAPLLGICFINPCLGNEEDVMAASPNHVFVERIESYSVSEALADGGDYSCGLQVLVATVEMMGYQYIVTTTCTAGELGLGSITDVIKTPI